MTKYCLPFSKLSMNLTSEVGGKNASLGEMFQNLSDKGIQVPDGFASTSKAYGDLIDQAGIRDEMQSILAELDREELKNLKDVGGRIRKMIMGIDIPDEIREAVLSAFHDLQERTGEGEDLRVAVRSSATAEDLPSASFAGQLETYLNVSGDEGLMESWKKCVASLFTDRAIKYREHHGFPHMEVALSVGVQKMVRSDLASSGVAFTLDPDSGFDKVVTINGVWGLGENIVQGKVDPDEFTLFKDNVRQGLPSIISRTKGKKSIKMVYTEGQDHVPGKAVTNLETTEEEQDRFVLNNDEVEKLGKWCLTIEDHYQKAMDIEWALDGNTGDMFIVQARPETVHANRERSIVGENYTLLGKGKELTRGIALGDRIASGKARILESSKDSDKLKEGEVLVTDITDPDWDPIMKKAAAIVTNKGGRTSHAAIVARELGVVAVVGTGNATEVIEDGQEITVVCSEGKTGLVYDGNLEWKKESIEEKDISIPDTDPMLILADPGKAFKYASLPNRGVGLLRLEFMINNVVGVHPMALLYPEKIEGKDDEQKIQELTKGYEDPEEYFIDHLSQGVATVAAAFHPHDVIVRMSDFKTNEYADLIGGKAFEPEEENPMLGFRGASRYYHSMYKEGFRLECEAMKRVRDEWGFHNVKLMIPFCRTPEEGRKVIDVMKEFGLEQGVNDLEIFVMIEIPSNVILADKFAELFDGFSIGSNDLTQLTLGLDRDSGSISELFDEENPAVQQMIEKVMYMAREKNIKTGFCGQAPSDKPAFAKFLVNQNIDSISFNPDAFIKGVRNIADAEKERKEREEDRFPFEGTYM